MTRLFSPEHRQRVLESLLEAFKGDPRIAGILISMAFCLRDSWSLTLVLFVWQIF